MKKIQITLSIILISFTFYSCKKQDKQISKEFATVSFADPSSIGNNINLLYEGSLLVVPGWNSGAKVTILPGDGKFTFVDKNSGIKLLDTVLNIDPKNPKTYYLLRPDPNIPMQLLQNNQEKELPIRDGYVKVRFTNFAKTGLQGNKIKVVFNQLDWDMYEYVAVDTLENVTSQTLETYTEIKRNRTMLDNDGNLIIDGDYMLTFLDENDQPILNSGQTPVSAPFFFSSSVYTIFLMENLNPGADPYVYSLAVFEN